MLDRSCAFWYTSSRQHTPHRFSIPWGRKENHERSTQARSALFSTADRAWTLELSSTQPRSTRLSSSREEPTTPRQTYACRGHCQPPACPHPGACSTRELARPAASACHTRCLEPARRLDCHQINTLLMQEAAHQHFSGSVLLAHHGKVLLSKGYSMADWSKQVSNTPHTTFYLGSTTKQFTAMAILILQAQSKLQVHDHICSYLAPCPHTWQQVTIHELLTHTSGIPEFDHTDVSNAYPQSWITDFDDVPLGFAPGSEFSYCNVCYQILGYVVEKVSGEPYCTFLQQTIFDPLQMKNSGCEQPYLSIPDHAIGYASWRVQDVPIGLDAGLQWSFLCGAGLLYSTVEDLFRWDQALSSHTLISQQVLDEAFTPYVPSQYAGSSYGYGWFIAKAPIAGHGLTWHDGRVDGFRTYNGLYLDDGVTSIS